MNTDKASDIMSELQASIRVGTRSSKLALIQTRDTITRLKAAFPHLAFEEIPVTTPGDRDRTTDLKVSPPDFFTRDLDEGVISGKFDCAVHSAKDMPDPVPAGIDWFWLPWREDPGDSIVLPVGRTVENMPAGAKIGISSERREAWCKKRFPGARLCLIRGTIEERLAQLDKGDYDMVIIATAALQRLGLQNRISEQIPCYELAPPDGQGILALTFRAGDERFLRLRSLFVKSVSFIGAGAGSADTCTLGGIKALRRCEVCLYDSLMDQALLDFVPKTALCVDTGKRCGSHSMPQASISNLITIYARRGLKVVRLKGGDPGIFGRLAEETDALDDIHIPYTVTPGVSSFNAATTSTGMLMTRRGVSRGFCIMTPRKQNGGTGSVQKDERAKLPVTFFMGVSVTGDVTRQLMDEGMPGETPAAMVFSAGSDAETIIRGTLNDITGKVKGDAASCAELTHDMPGLLLVGEVTKFGFNRTWGAMEGCRILLTCSQDIMDKAADAVRDLGGIPVKRPLIKLVPEAQAVSQLKIISQYDWIILTSPASVRCFFDLLKDGNISLKTLPKIIVCGPGTANELRKYRVEPHASPPSDFGADGLVQIAGTFIKPAHKVLRLRSNKAGSALADFLKTLDAKVTDCILYRNDPIKYDSLGEFDAVFFASASAVETFIAQWGTTALKDKVIAAIGKPTQEGLSSHNIRTDVVGREATVDSTIAALAGKYVREALEKIK